VKTDGKGVAAVDPLELFGMYLQVTGVASLECPEATDPGLRGKSLGIVNGSSWILLWSMYFGRLLLPGVRLINVGNEAVQLNFMRAHREGNPVPPELNIELFARYARDLATLCDLDAILITCSTMNRAHGAVRAAVASFHVPVVQIDEPMMEAAVRHGGRILVIATHGPTVENTQRLLAETGRRLGRDVSFTGLCVEEAFDMLGRGDVRGHNEAIAEGIRRIQERERVDVAVLAQLSMSVFRFSHPDCRKEFGIPVLTSAEEGFTRVRQLLVGHSPSEGARGKPHSAGRSRGMREAKV
jgi:Asp/Glu/hydantoin racemase